MAGIGFRLQKLLSGDDYTSSLKAYAFSTLITAGPFLITVVLVLFIQRLSLSNLTVHAMAYLQALITHAYAFSLITVGVSYLVVTRYVADEYYRGHVTSFTASFFSAYAINLLVWGPWVFWFFSGLDAGWAVRLNAMLLYSLAVGIWLAMIYLSAAHGYWEVSRSFLAGMFVSMAGAWLLGRTKGLPGYFSGFVAGQAVVLFLLVWTMIKEFGYWEARDHNWLRYFRLHPRLAAIGLFYNLGIWVDKFVFWYSHEGERLDSRLRYSLIYDSPMFFAYLTILPSLVYFFLQVETDFFFKYHDYYLAIQKQEGLAVLELRRREIVASLRHSLKRLLTVQGICSCLALVLVPWIVELARMNPLQMSVLRIGIYAAFLQAGALIFLNILFYFDHQPEALAVAFVFCLLNALCTAATLRLGLPAYGYGYAAACMGSLALGVYFINERLRLLHFWTFMRQPLPRPVVVADESESEI